MSYRMAVVTASLTASTTPSTTSPGMAAGSCCKLVRTAHPSPARQLGDAARSFPATARRRRYGRHGLAEGPAGPGSTAPSPDERGGGLAPTRPRPAAALASRHRHGPLRLGQWPP